MNAPDPIQHELSERAWHLLQQELVLEYVRSRGPGGQNVNRTNSACWLCWNVYATKAISWEQQQKILHKCKTRISVEGELQIRAERFRDQLQNRQDALDRLRELIEQALHVPKIRKATRPSRRAKAKRVDAKRVRSGIKQNRGRVRGDLD